MSGRRKPMARSGAFPLSAAQRRLTNVITPRGSVRNSRFCTLLTSTLSSRSLCATRAWASSNCRCAWTRARSARAASQVKAATRVRPMEAKSSGQRMVSHQRAITAPVGSSTTATRGWLREARKAITCVTPALPTATSVPCSRWVSRCCQMAWVARELPGTWVTACDPASSWLS